MELIITLAVLCGLFLVALIFAIFTRPKSITISNDAPKDIKYGVLKLQEELKPYVYEKDGKVCIDILKRKGKKTK